MGTKSVQYGYDYASNRMYRDIDSSIYATNDKDQAYTYDALHRLDLAQQGTLSGSTISGTPVREEDWTLDALGNFSNYLTKANGTTTLNQSRTHNKANEITAFSGVSTGIAHDSAGNVWNGPKPTSWTSAYKFFADAWNRVVHVKDGANSLVKFSYDGRNYRIRKEVYSAGTLSYTDHTYYNDGWQALEVRRETAGTEDPDPREQFVWHPEYIDSLAVRYYDSDTDGNLAELSDGTHYYTHDANYNVTAIATATGTVLERYQYDPYGKLTVLDANFATDADSKSDIDNATTYTGRWQDPESTRYDFRNREYDPITGRFLERDPIGYGGGDRNLYAFVGDSPVNKLDPTGEVVMEYPPIPREPLPCGGWIPQWLCDFVWPPGPPEPPDASDIADLLSPMPIGMVAKGGAKVCGKVCKPALKKVLDEADKLYPKLKGIWQKHHKIPKYIGGAADGELISNYLKTGIGGIGVIS